MDALVKFLEKQQPKFDKISSNMYLQAIKDGFLVNMPIILFSSLFLLIATMPGMFGIELPQVILDFANKCNDFTMGVLGIMVAGTTAKVLTGSFNRSKMPAGRVLNDTSTQVAAMCGMLVLAVTKTVAPINDTDTSVMLFGNMGTKGLFSSFIAAFVAVHVYAFCVKRDITIHLPKEVPGTIAQSFRDIFPFSFTMIICTLVDFVVRYFLNVPFAEALGTLLAPLFSAADSYPGLIIYQALIAFFWFMGIHGPSVVRPPLYATLLANTEANLQLFQAGEHASHAFTYNLTLIGDMGGTGCTFLVPIIFMLFMRSKQLKAVGKASFIPTLFAVNEPVLFGAPLILNPYFFVPFILAPVANIVIFKFFVSTLGMNGQMYTIPWSTPGPIGMIMSTGFAPLSFVLAIVLLVVDFIIYYPFCKAYDNSLCKQEAAIDAELEAADGGEAALTAASDEQVATAAGDAKASAGTPNFEAGKKRVEELGRELKVLVLCAGAGTSALLANALTEGSGPAGIPIIANSGAYGSHYDIMDQYDVIVLAPQVRTYFDDIKADTDRLSIKLIGTKGKQYIDLTNDPKGAVDFIVSNFGE